MPIKVIVKNQKFIIIPNLVPNYSEFIKYIVSKLKEQNMEQLNEIFYKDSEQNDIFIDSDQSYNDLIKLCDPPKKIVKVFVLTTEMDSSHYNNMSCNTSSINQSQKFQQSFSIIQANQQSEIMQGISQQQQEQQQQEQQQQQVKQEEKQKTLSQNQQENTVQDFEKSEYNQETPQNLKKLNNQITMVHNLQESVILEKCDKNRILYVSDNTESQKNSSKTSNNNNQEKNDFVIQQNSDFNDQIRIEEEKQIELRRNEIEALIEKNPNSSNIKLSEQKQIEQNRIEIEALIEQNTPAILKLVKEKILKIYQNAQYNQHIQIKIDVSEVIPEQTNNDDQKQESSKKRQQIIDSSKNQIDYFELNSNQDQQQNEKNNCVNTPKFQPSNPQNIIMETDNNFFNSNDIVQQNPGSNNFFEMNFQNKNNDQIQYPNSNICFDQDALQQKNSLDDSNIFEESKEEDQINEDLFQQIKLILQPNEEELKTYRQFMIKNPEESIEHLMDIFSNMKFQLKQ